MYKFFCAQYEPEFADDLITSIDQWLFSVCIAVDMLIQMLCVHRLRTLSDSGTSGPPLSEVPSTPPVATSFGPPQYKLAEHRYGREEMLALYTTASSIVPDLSDTSIMLSKPLGPLSLEVMSAEEQVDNLSSH